MNVVTKNRLAQLTTRLLRNSIIMAGTQRHAPLRHAWQAKIGEAELLVNGLNEVEGFNLPSHCQMNDGDKFGFLVALDYPEPEVVIPITGEMEDRSGTYNENAIFRPEWQLCTKQTELLLPVSEYRKIMGQQLLGTETIAQAMIKMAAEGAAINAHKSLWKKRNQGVDGVAGIPFMVDNATNYLQDRSVSQYASLRSYVDSSATILTLNQFAKAQIQTNIAGAQTGKQAVYCGPISHTWVRNEVEEKMTVVADAGKCQFSDADVVYAGLGFFADQFLGVTDATNETGEGNFFMIDWAHFHCIMSDADMLDEGDFERWQDKKGMMIATADFMVGMGLEKPSTQAKILNKTTPLT